MKSTVAICTWNRASLLEQTLERLRSLQTPPELDWELLVVNNNCTDATDEVLKRFAGLLPLRRLFEPRAGQSFARNCAIAAASGDCIAWTDDDVLVDPHWLAEYATAFERWPDVAFFGGPIEPWFEEPAPDWLLRSWPLFAAAYATRDFGSEPFEFQGKRLPFGANFAVRTAVQREYPFDTDLGLRPGSAVRGDETTLLARMLAAGRVGRWVPTARVRHFIPKERMTFEYLHGFFFGSGQCDVIKWRKLGPEAFARKRRLMRLRSWLVELRYLLRRPVCRPEVWMGDLFARSLYRGRMDQLARLTRDVGVEPASRLGEGASP